MFVFARILELLSLRDELEQVRHWFVSLNDTNFLLIMFFSAMLLAFTAARALR
jgi:hypothetical protein